ncbi:FAD binding domain-containing protein [candidate division WOR-3 bacterium]|nr:FAD binding domain-containing protein [candidate division WOR-3 bacterium]
MVSAYRPENLKEALLRRKEFRVIPFAGGTDLMVKGRRWSGLAPHFKLPVLFIGHLGELKNVELEQNCLRIGSCCTLSYLLENENMPQAIKIALWMFASPAIRNIGTIGGNICNASPAGDTLPVLYAVNASVVLKNMNGIREVPIEQFIKGVGKTVLQDDELLKEIIIPIKSFDIIYYRKIGTRKANALSKISFLGLAKMKNGLIEDIRISFGAVAPTVVGSREIEDRLKGKTKKDIKQIIPEICSQYSTLLKPIDDQRSNAYYRKTVSLRLLKHFLTTEIL